MNDKEYLESISTLIYVGTVLGTVALFTSNIITFHEFVFYITFLTLIRIVVLFCND